MVLLSWIMRGLAVGGVLSLAAVTLLYVFQEKMLYVPRVPGVPEIDERLVPDRWGFDSQDVWFEAADGARLHAWLLTLRGWSPEFIRSRPVLVFFQENAGNMSHRLPLLRLLAQQLRVPIFAPSYRGYFLSERRPPNEKGLQADATAALAALLRLEGVDGSRVVLFGRSLGGAVAMHLAANHSGDQVTGLIVENTFTSVEDMVPKVLPPLGAFFGTGKPLNFLVTNKWRNVEAITRVPRGLPLLMLASEQDEMVPFWQMEALRRAAGYRPALTWQAFPNAYHMDAYQSDAAIYWPTLRSFFLDNKLTKD